MKNEKEHQRNAEKTCRHGGGTEPKARNRRGPTGKPTRSEERLRAILRAGPVVCDAYRAGRIGKVLAAKLGPKNPTPGQASSIAWLIEQISGMTDRGEIDALVSHVVDDRETVNLRHVIRELDKMSPGELTGVAAFIEQKLAASPQ